MYFTSKIHNAHVCLNQSDTTFNKTIIIGVFNACQIKKKEVAAEQTGLQRHSAEFY
jgi:hypothetical protein